MIEFPRKDCRAEFIAKDECELIEKNITLQVQQIRKDLKTFRNQISYLIGGGFALATLILAVLQYIESLR
jgi:hypothetical protein